jgi:hypothetical protein
MAIHIQVRECLDAFPVDLDENSDIQDELGRFRVWAGNIAAHRPSHSRRSLEYRLRDSLRLRDTVLSLLRDLKRALDELRGSLIPVDMEEGSRHQPDREARGGDDDGQDEEYGDAEDMFELSDEESIENVTHTQRAIDEIHDVITCLLRFSIALRNPGRNNLRKDDPDGQGIAQSFVAHYINHVREKFPVAPQYLVDRVGKSMSKHRQYFRYRKSHNEKLRADLTDIEVDAWERPSTVATSLFVTDTPRLGIERLEFETESNYTATSYEGSFTGDARLEIPKWPVEAQEGSPFECPLCYGILEAETETSWRHHVFEDIPPYVCTNEACGSAIKSFSRRHEWARHEMETHTKLWLCPYGCTEPISSSKDFESHVRTIHHLADSADASAVRNLTAACGRAESREGARSCPLCMKICDSAKRWTKHVGHHLEQLALFSLPMDLLSGDTPDGSDGRSDMGSNVDRDMMGTQSQTTAYMNTKHGDAITTFLELDPPPTRGTSDQAMAIIAVRSEGSNSPPPTSLGTEELANIRAQGGTINASAPDPAEMPKPKRKPSADTQSDDTNEKIEQLKAMIEKQEASRSAREAEEKAAGRAAKGAREESDKKLAEAEAEKAELGKKQKELEEAVAKAAAPLPDMLKAPIKFKDAVGRNFSFPWHLCKTWVGMESLIKQAFLHVDGIETYVQEGHYELMGGPEGGIILPQVWDTMISPGWEVSMHMWPIPETPKKEKKIVVAVPDPIKPKKPKKVSGIAAWMAGHPVKPAKKPRLGIGQVVDVPPAGRSRLLSRDTSQKPKKRYASI